MECNQANETEALQSESMYLDFPSSWGSRAGPVHGLLWTARTRGSVSEPGNGFSGAAEKCWSAEGGLTTTCSEQYTFAAHRERGTTVLSTHGLTDAQQHSACWPQASSASFMCRGSILEFIGTRRVLTHSPFQTELADTYSIWAMTVKKLPRTSLCFAVTCFPHQ